MLIKKGVAASTIKRGMAKMTSDVYNECVKALAYGYSAADVASIMEVTEEEVKNISKEKVAAKREELKGKGYIR